MTRLALWGPVLVVTALIYAGSSLPDPGAPPGGMSDKSAHVLAYAALGATLMRAMAGGRAAAMTLRRIAGAALLASLYGATDELHQHFVPGRTPDSLDLVADACGAVAGASFTAAAARLLRGWRRARRRIGERHAVG